MSRHESYLEVQRGAFGEIFPITFLMPSPVGQHPNTPRRGHFLGQGWFLLCFPAAAVTRVGSALVPADMQPAPSWQAAKADPSPLIQPALSHD